MSVPAVLAIEGRIAAIQSRFGAHLTVAAAGTASSTSPATAAGAAASFDATLAAATGTGAQRSGTGTGATGADVVAAARAYLGVPYVKGGDDPSTGLDCSGLTELVYAKFGIDLPPVSWEQVQEGRAVASLSDARPGDLVFFGRPTSHVGIYMGDGKMVHAPRPGKSVEVSSVYETPSAIRRVLPDAAAAAPATAGSAGQASVAGLVPALRQYAGPLGDVPYAAQFRAAEARHGVPARVLAALAEVESGYRADAVSPAGARGLMQFMPATARSMGVDPLDPASAVDGAARLLKKHVQEFGSLPLALAAYNAGEGAVRRYDGVPPFAETQNHGRKILAILNGASS